MYYQKQDGKLIRPLPGYFDGFKSDLKNVDAKLLSEFQADYMSIPDDEIYLATTEEHETYTYNQNINAQRKAEYAENDALYMEITYDAMIAGKTTKYTPWKDAVKAKKDKWVKK